MNLNNAKKIQLNGKNVKNIKDKNGNIIWRQPDYYFAVTALSDNCSIVIQDIYTTRIQNYTFYYSIGNTNNWISCEWYKPTRDTHETKKISLNLGQTIYFYGENATLGLTRAIYCNFKFEGNVSISGNIVSLLNKDISKIKSFNRNFVFGGLFRGNATLIDAKELILPKFTSEFCYSYMFFGCTGLQRAPVLPAMVLSNYCYEWMFSLCSALDETPILPADKIAPGCYFHMFDGCVNLNKISKINTSSSSDVDTYSCDYMYYDTNTKRSTEKDDEYKYEFLIKASNDTTFGNMFSKNSTIYPIRTNTQYYIDKEVR